MRWNMTGFGMILILTLVSGAFGQENGAAIPSASPASLPVVADLSNRPAHALAQADESKGRWWISETIAQSRKDQPVFFGVRLANTPQVALVETYRQAYIAGEKLAVRLWGCNDLPMQFKGRVQVPLKQGDKQFASEEESVRLAPETVKCLAKYSFDTENLAAGQYTLETLLFDNTGELFQRRMTTVTIKVI